MRWIKNTWYVYVYTHTCRHSYGKLDINLYWETPLTLNTVGRYARPTNKSLPDVTNNGRSLRILTTEHNGFCWWMTNVNKASPGVNIGRRTCNSIIMIEYIYYICIWSKYYDVMSHYWPVISKGSHLLFWKPGLFPSYRKAPSAR